MKLSKTSIIAAACLGAVALTSVGFAGWKIVSDAGAEKSGNIKVYEITNNAVSITDAKWYNGAKTTDNEITGEDVDVVFGRPATPGNTRSNTWFDYESDGTGAVAEECFPVYSFKLTDYSGSTPKVEAKISIDSDTTGGATTPSTDALTAYYNCVNGSTTDSNKYITGPGLVTSDYKIADNATCTVTGLDSPSTTSTAEGFKTYDVKVNLGFGWGDFFKKSDANTNINPFYFFDDAKSDTNVSKAIKAMSAIEKIKGFKYKVTITATSGTSN